MEKPVTSAISLIYGNISGINRSEYDQNDSDYANNTLFYGPDPFVESYCNRLDNFIVFQSVINILIVGILILFGWIGNTLAIIVLRSVSTNKTVTFLLQALAVADNMYLIACLFIQTLRAISVSTDWIPNYVFVERYAWSFAAISQTAAIWIVVLVTADRYIAICHPFKVSCLCTLARAQLMVVVIVVVASLYNIPRFFEHNVEWVYDYCIDDYRYVTVHSTFRRGRVYFIVYKTCFYLIFRLFFPLVTLFVLNTKLILVLKNETKNHASLTKTNPKKDSFTIVLVTVVTIFLICELPDAILRILGTISHFTSFGMDRINLSYANTITNMLLTVNSSVNCLIYSITGQMFRKRLKRLCSRKTRSHSTHIPYYYQCSDDRVSAALVNKTQPAVGQNPCNGTATEVITSSTLLKDTSM